MKYSAAKKKIYKHNLMLAPEFATVGLGLFPTKSFLINNERIKWKLLNNFS